MDPGDAPRGRIRVEPGQRVVVTPIAAVGFNDSNQVGANDLLFSLLVVLTDVATGWSMAACCCTDSLMTARRWHSRPPGAVSTWQATRGDGGRPAESRGSRSPHEVCRHVPFADQTSADAELDGAATDVSTA